MTAVNFLFRKGKIFNKEVPVVVIIWFAFAIIASVVQVLRPAYNNYLIYKGVFWHTLHQQNLYVRYPTEYFDTNHYGPVFSLLIAPFALLPDKPGAIIWGILNAAVLLYAIYRLPFTQRQQLMIAAIAAIEMMTSTHNLQVNPLFTAWVLFAFLLVEKEKDFWAALFIALGFFVKLYGIAALLFFVFSRHKIQFILSFLFWCVVLFCLPMLISSPRFIIQSYVDWYHSLMEKNAQNTFSLMQNISVMGMIRKIGHWTTFNDLYVLILAALLIAAPLLRFKQYTAKEFRLSYLAIVLISVVIFSTSAESATYVIAMVGAGVWYVLNQHLGKPIIFTLIFVLTLTSLSSTDLFPKYLQAHYVRVFALKALPCFIIWLWLIQNVAFKNFLKENKLQPA